MGMEGKSKGVLIGNVGKDILATEVRNLKEGDGKSKRVWVMTGQGRTERRGEGQALRRGEDEIVPSEDAFEFDKLIPVEFFELIVPSQTRKQSMEKEEDEILYYVFLSLQSTEYQYLYTVDYKDETRV
ncbi:hypothetical protein MA16_Dca007188 [Dendrobium catenatum]|uniref:Uncharacterized protein n=1 Tax=Dendrobium catenatum TaxID=906689 RepID=A0A2I0W438_9ASPA|nr:hypothetical protein MA16_Dca007188 [Dendrobium catenatum]